MGDSAKLWTDETIPDLVKNVPKKLMKKAETARIIESLFR
jgi:hypothetical protein